MDHRQCDAAARGPDGKPLFPWVTAVMDVRSRRLLGWYLHSGPNQDTILAALRRALLRYGVPRHLLVDNGKDFRAKALTGGRKGSLEEGRIRALTQHLGIACHFAAPYNPKAKPIERAFRTLKEWMERRFEAYRGGSPGERPEGLKHLWKRVEALPTLPQLDQLYGEFIEGVYNEHPHAGDGMEGRTPREVYDALLPNRAVVAPEALHLLLMRQTEPRLVRRNGVWVNDHGLWYRSAELLKRQGERIYLRYDLAEVGRAFAFDEADRFLCEATARPALAWGARQEDVRAALAEKRAHKRQAQAYRKLREEAVREPHPLKRAVEHRKEGEEGETLPAVNVRRRKKGLLERAAKEVAKLPTPSQRSQREEHAARERERLAALLPGPAEDPGMERDRAFEALFERLTRGETP